MRNIYELLGIIKGISFDGIINDKEVKRLQRWADKNRNLAYDPRQVEIVKMLDSVLEDHILEEHERQALLTCCESYLKEQPEDVTKVYELKGIIEGIVCDNVLNEKEIFYLKKWMQANGTSIRGHKPSEALCNVVDKILRDGVVTKDEQNYLLTEFTSLINGSHLKLKIAYLKKLVNARKNIGVDLIDLLDNEDAIDEIHGRAEIELKKALEYYSSSIFCDQEIIFISLVLIAMLHYNGSYYDSVRNTYKSLYEQYSEQKVEGMIRTILNKYRPLEEVQANRTRIINIALKNTIVPSYFLSAFFVFIYDIYKLNFEYDLSDDLAEDFRFVYEGLRNSMLSDGDDIKVNVTKKTYKLIQSTKQLIVNEKSVDAVIKLSIIVVKLIDKRVWNKDIKIFNPYLKTGYEGWLETLKKEKNTNTRRVKSEFRSRWEPKYLLQNNHISLIPPIHRVKAQYDYRDLRIVVKNNNRIVYSNNRPDIREIIGGYQVMVSNIRLENPIGNITYQLLAQDEVIYESKDKLFRSFLVFDMDGNEIRNNTDYTGTAVFCMPAEDNNFKTFYKSDSYILAAKTVHSGDTLLINETVFNFSTLIKPGILGDVREHHYIRENSTGKMYKVFRQIKYLVFEADHRYSSFEIIIDSKRNRIADFKCTMSERNGICKYTIEPNIMEDGMHSVEINCYFQGKKISILPRKIFGLDSILNTDILKLDEESYHVYVNTGLFEENVDKDILIYNYDEDLISFFWNDEKYNYLLPMSIDAYRLDGKQWKSINEEIWIGDIRFDSTIDIIGTSVNTIRLFGSDGKRIDENIVVKDCGVYQQMAVGFLTSYKLTQEYLVISFKDENREQKSIYCYNRCVWDGKNLEIAYDENADTVDILPKYHGKGNVFLTVCDASGNEIYRTGMVKNEVWETGFTLESFQKYHINVYEKERGLRLKKERLIREFICMVYAQKDFIGRSFRIPEIQYDIVQRGKLVTKIYKFTRIYVYFKEQISENLFIGELYARTNNGAFMYDQINPVEIEVCGDVIGNTLELAITKDGDGLLLDKVNHGIKNTLDDDTAVDIYSYLMNINGVKTF